MNKVELFLVENDIDYWAQKGYHPLVKVKLLNEKLYNLYFCDISYIRDTLDFYVRNSVENGFIAEPNMVILSEITKENMQKAVEQLYENGYFEHIKSVSNGEEINFHPSPDDLAKIKNEIRSN